MTEARPRERADAARNRRAILDATTALLAERGAEAVTMERVAAAAGVGKGTVFHRFGSRAGLLHELVAESALDLRERVRSGPPPLGPGAPAGERLVAFLEGMARLIIDNAELVRAYRSEPPHPNTAEFHAFWDAHLTDLVAAARPDLDAPVTGRLLLGALGSEVVPAMAGAGEEARLLAAVRALARSVIGAPAG